jgi:hypothetical protein
VPPFHATALCRIPVGKRSIDAGDTVTVNEIVVETNRDGWQKVGYVVTVGRYTATVPATKFVVGPEGECPNQGDNLGTFMVDWTYDDDAPYRKGKTK